MVSLPSLLACAILGAGSDFVLLDFTATWCGPCQQLQPVVQRLHQEGVRVQAIDIDQRPDLAQRFQVDAIPCFVLVHEGRVLDRAVGREVTYPRLRKMADRGQALAAGGAKPTSGAASPTSDGITPTSDVATRALSPPVQTRALADEAQQIALEAAVRIRVEEGSTHSLGSGAVIGVHGPDALVITCGHIFRASQGKGAITVDLFAQGTRRSVPGILLEYDADDRDIAVLAIRPGVPIQPIPVAPMGTSPQVGDEVFSVGCDRGANPSLMTGRLTGVNRYQGAPNLEASGQPVDGRSGGGLFSRTGHLLGICNAADPGLVEGIYSSLPSIHWMLARIGQEQLYAGGARPSANASHPPTLAAAPPLARPFAAPPPGVAPPAVEASAELLCIVRTEDGESQIRVRNPSPELLRQIRLASEQGSLSGL